MMKDKDVTELPIKSLICHRADLFTKSKFSFSWNCTIFNKQESKKDVNFPEWKVPLQNILERMFIPFRYEANEKRNMNSE